MKRDLSQKQLIAAAAKHGIEPDFMGYWRLPVGGISVYGGNGGRTRRDQLDYLVRMKTKHSEALATA